MLEGVVPNDRDLLPLNANELKNSAVRAHLLEDIPDNAEGKIDLAFGAGDWEEGDPENILIELLFENVEGETLSERQDMALSKLFGWVDPIVYVDHDAAILAARDRARAKLGGLRDEFNAGLAPGEYLLLKGPFETPSGENEWMWIEVISWSKNEIVGLLQNQPYHIPDLRPGSEVKLDQADVFDYIRRLPDGSSEGNETGNIMRQR